MHTWPLKSKSKNTIKSSDQLIRFIMDYDFEFSVGAVKHSAFQTSHLEKGLSVSIKAILDHITRQRAITQLEKNGTNTYVRDCEAIVHDINNILKGSLSPVFDIKHSPLPDNKAHADVLFSNKHSLNRAEKKLYKHELMQAFGV